MNANHGDVNITTSYEMISPEMANAFLANSDGNRAVNWAAVKRYADDMRNGDWLLTHQGIAFDKDGRLIDGQHRLHAIIASGQSINMAVSNGVPKENAIDIDSGTARSTQAQIQIGYGASVNNRAIGVIKMLYLLFYGENKPSTAKIISAYNKSSESFDFVSKMTVARYLSTAPVFASYAVALKSGVSKSDISEFHKCLLHIDGKSSPSASRLNSILNREYGLSSQYHRRLRCFILTGLAVNRHILGIDKKFPHLSDNLSIADSIYKGNPLQ